MYVGRLCVLSEVLSCLHLGSIDLLKAMKGFIPTMCVCVCGGGGGGGGGEELDKQGSPHFPCLPLYPICLGNVITYTDN